MTKQLQAVRGMNDILPTDIHLWHSLEAILREVMHSFGYKEIRMPILESLELFKRSIGEATDIVEKEMFSFIDREKDHLALRPEGTAGCVRAGIEHGLLYHQIQRLWYIGPYFRHERPQKGRYRQFHQCGAEVFGLEGPDIDAELILLAARILEKIGLKDHVTLEINSLGTPQTRVQYKEKLVHYFTQHHAQLDEDSQRRLTTNPLRILDSKNPAMRELIANAPKLSDHLDAESAQHFEQLQHYLTQMNIPFKVNPCLVRGLDYYTKTVFEWVTTALGSQGAVCSGGRYDGLVEQLGGKPTPGLGFAFGLERLILLIQETQQMTEKTPDYYLMTDSATSFQKGLEIAQLLREKGYCVIQHCGGGSFKNQFKKADKSGAKYALVLGEEEYKNNHIAIKPLREMGEQKTLPFTSLDALL